jgi:hypothetical protein
VVVAIAIAVAISVAVADSVAIAVAITHRCHHWPLLLWLTSTIATAVSVALPSAIVVAVVLAVGHCCHHHRQQSQLPSLSAITVAIALSHFQELLPWRGKNCIQPIEAKNAYLILFCLVCGWRTDRSRMADQVSSGNGQHQHLAASGNHQAASEESGWQQGGSRGQQGGDVD